MCACRPRSKGECPVRVRIRRRRRYAALRARAREGRGRDSCSPPSLSLPLSVGGSPSLPPWSYEGQRRFEWGIWRNDSSPPFRGRQASSSLKVCLAPQGRRKGRRGERERERAASTSICHTLEVLQVARVRPSVVPSLPLSLSPSLLLSLSPSLHLSPPLPRGRAFSARRKQIRSERHMAFVSRHFRGKSLSFSLI